MSVSTLEKYDCVILYKVMFLLKYKYCYFIVANNVLLFIWTNTKGIV